MSSVVKFLIWCGVFFLSCTVAGINPIPSVFPLVWFVPLFVITFRFMRENEVVKQGEISEPKYFGLLKAVLGFLSAIVASGLDVPIINQIIEAITMILGNGEAVETAIRLVISFVLGLYTIFAKKDSAIGFVANGFKQLPKKGKEIHIDNNGNRI